jgi:hypothetical protein
VLSRSLRSLVKAGAVTRSPHQTAKSKQHQVRLIPSPSPNLFTLRGATPGAPDFSHGQVSLDHLLGLRDAGTQAVTVGSIDFNVGKLVRENTL